MRLEKIEFEFELDFLPEEAQFTRVPRTNSQVNGIGADPRSRLPRLTRLGAIPTAAKMLNVAQMLKLANAMHWYSRADTTPRNASSAVTANASREHGALRGAMRDRERPLLSP